MNDAISFNNVNFFYGSFQALTQMNFRVPTGKIMGLLGPNGSGKSTTINLLTGQLTPTSGEIWILGNDLGPSHLENRKRVGYSPEEPFLYSGLTGWEFLELSGNVYGLEKNQVKEVGMRLLDQFDMLGRKDNPIGSYSKGMKRKLLHTASMLHEPDILFLDEPMEGLDIHAQKFLQDELLRLKSLGKTVLFSTHIVEKIEKVCDSICMIEQGQVLACGDLKEIKKKLGISEFELAFSKRKAQ